MTAHFFTVFFCHMRIIVIVIIMGKESWAQVEKLGGNKKFIGELGNDITGVSITLLLSSDLNGPWETNNSASIGRFLDPCFLSFFHYHVLLLGNTG